MAKFRRLRITALLKRMTRSLPVFPKNRPVLPLMDVQGKSSHRSLTYLPAVYAIAAPGVGGAWLLNTKGGYLFSRRTLNLGDNANGDDSKSRSRGQAPNRHLPPILLAEFLEC